MATAHITRLGRTGGLFDGILVIALLASAVLHAGSIWGAVLLGNCVRNRPSIVCPGDQECKMMPGRIDVELAEKEPPPPPPKRRPQRELEPEQSVVVEQPQREKPAAAPKAGRIVLPEEAFEQEPPSGAEITVDRPSLSQDVVARESEAEAPVVATGEIFGRADEVSPGEPGEYGLGGTGTAVGLGPFGTDDEGGGGTAIEGSAPRAEPEPEPEPEEPKGVSRPPQVLNWTKPPYPEQARQQGVEGTVVVHVTVNASGEPSRVRVARSSGHSGLDEAAVAQVRRAQFSPALEEGKPVSMRISFKVRFRLVNE